MNAPVLNRPLTILADWGTTRMRLYLCDCTDPAEPELLGSVVGPGVKFDRDFANVFREYARHLPTHGGAADVVITGMVGSNMGWHDTGYVACPMDWKNYVSNSTRFTLGDYDIAILPGASFANEFAYRDIMRGEEVQVLGALRIGTVDAGKHLFCLPGTHTKWVVVDGHSLDAFATSMQGELFDMLVHDSVLVPPGEADALHAGIVEEPFSAGVGILEAYRGLGFAEALFSVRCNNVSGHLPAADTVSYLSGIVVAADVRDVGARLLEKYRIEHPVMLVGESALAGLYAQALSAFGIESRILDSQACTLQGLHACRWLQAEEVVREA